MRTFVKELNKRRGPIHVTKCVGLVLGAIVVLMVFDSRSLYQAARLNQLNVATARWFLANNVSVADLGLRLEYGDGLDPSPLAVHSSTVKCEPSSPRLSLRSGMIRMLIGDFDKASQCLLTTLASNQNALDGSILLMSVYHLAGQRAMSRAMFERLPREVRSTAPIAAQVILDYEPVTQFGLRGTSWLDQFETWTPRKLLFHLLYSNLRIAQGFLEKAIQAGLLSSTDRSDFISLSKWLIRQEYDQTNQQVTLPSGNDPQRIQELRRSVGASLGCAEDSLVFGPNLVSGGFFDTPQQLNHWRNLPWTYGAETFNQGGFAFGLDALDDDHSAGALRISGLWKNDDAKLYPASGTLQHKEPLKLLKGKQLYIVLARYRTENVRSGLPIVRLLDPTDHQLLVGNWRLEPTGSTWQEVYAVGYIDGDSVPVVSPLISQYALGTVWIDYLQVMPVYLDGCNFGDETTIFGKMPGQE